MSIARLNTVAKSRAEYTCGHHPTHVIPAGSGYRWFKVGFRGRKQFRCLDHYPSNSSRESSMLATVYAAQEDAEANLRALPVSDDHSAISEEVQAVYDAAEEVADQYEEADEAMGGMQGDNYERAEACREGAYELDGWEPGADLGCEDHDEPKTGCEDCQSSWDEAIDEAVTVVNEADFSM